MSDHDHNKNTAPTAMVVLELPAQIIKGYCSSCGTDLNDLAEKIALDTEPQTYHCTGCGIELATDKMEVRRWRCKACRRPLIKYGHDLHCSGCGRELIYPEGGDQHQEESK